MRVLALSFFFYSSDSGIPIREFRTKLRKGWTKGFSIRRRFDGRSITYELDTSGTMVHVVNVLYDVCIHVLVQVQVQVQVQMRHQLHVA